MIRFGLLIAAVSLSAQCLSAAETVPPELAAYIAKKDNSFAWKQVSKGDTDYGSIVELEMTSQKWQDFTWKHAIQIFIPKGTKPQSTMIIYNTGGDPNPLTGLLGLSISNKVGAPIAFVYGIPNQPIFEKKEDALIAQTFCKYLETKDPTWPLLFPMAKAIVRSMDALQAYAKEKWDAEVKEFVVTGASKRGWTSWLTAATGDKRVKAIAPMVIDTLNFPAQMPHQVKSFGDYSVMIKDYTESGLIKSKDKGNETAENLWKMVDPYHYRSVVKQPKLIINGTNDPYWTLDALNLYWDDLLGDKFILYVPNAGHGLEQDYGNGKKDRERVLNTLSAFGRCNIEGKPFPTPTWKYSDSPKGSKLDVNAGKDVVRVRLWQAESDTRDFRKSVWKDTVCTLEDGKTCVEVPCQDKGFRAAFVECEYKIGDLPFYLSTQMKILEPKAKK